VSEEPGRDEDVATDTSLLLNFLRLDRIDIFAQLPGFRFLVLNHVIAEVTDAEQAERLAQALANGAIVEFELMDLDAILVYDELRRVLGDGEAATIAAAAAKGLVLAMDEKGRARREAEARVGSGRLLNTPGVLVHAVRQGTLTLAEAEQVRLDLVSERFAIKATVAELLGTD
jgi:predicted nucleic acid-binding protein